MCGSEGGGLLYVWSCTSQNHGCIRNEQGGIVWIICSAIITLVLTFQHFKHYKYPDMFKHSICTAQQTQVASVLKTNQLIL
jgi:hypothetical protein